MARDILHEIVRKVLELDGWIITHDPYTLKYNPGWAIDLGAEKIVAAEKDNQKIAVEVKSFREESFANEFHTILGQYLNYRSALKRIDEDRILFLAVPKSVYNSEFTIEGIINSVEDYNVRILVYDFETKKIIKWLN